ncbi:MAG TPA: phospho-sugar mutase, partial [Cyclobacteriaceae bacterium]|nr:phospho-sugar mutase [Cyclobacteriaceae bacterium]
EQEIKRMMEKFRNQPPNKIGGNKVVRMLDYKTSLEKNLLTQSTSKIDLPASDVLQFYTEDGSKISVRPSGTEPKIKFYISVKTDLNSKGDFKKVSENLDSKIKAIEVELV